MHFPCSHRMFIYFYVPKSLAIQCHMRTSHQPSQGNPCLVINGFKELANDKWYRLDAFDFALCQSELLLEIFLFILDIAFLEIEYLKETGEFLVFDVEVFLLHLFIESIFPCSHRMFIYFCVPKSSAIKCHARMSHRGDLQFYTPAIYNETTQFETSG